MARLRADAEKLSNRERITVMNYLKNGYNITKAARDAGYLKHPHKRGYDVLHKPNVAKFINKRINEIEDELKMGVKWNIQKLKRIADLAVPDNEKLPAGSKRDYMAAIAAIAELNKMGGHYAPTKTINASLNSDVSNGDFESLLEHCKRDF
jgi:phage terminase small subunit